jgi:type VI secretion system protein ImpG
MVDELLPYYDRELSYLRRLAAEFAQAHPEAAGQLRISPDTIEDPHVARLMEATAFLNARIRRKIDDDFPELTDAILGVLYPHYLAPIPSMAIVRFDCQDDLTGSFTLPAGTEIETEAVKDETCRFRTCYETELWPIEVAEGKLSGLPLTAPPNPRASGAAACLRLSLRCVNDSMTISELGPERLRFFLRGQPQEVYPLYEMLFNNVISVALADSASDPNPVILGADAIRAVGFEPAEGVMPFPKRSFLGYRLLTEYFAFPEKYLFFDVTNLSAKTLLESGRTLEVFIYFNRASKNLERSVSRETFGTGCTPVVNLFHQRAEPIRLTQTKSEYRVVPDARREGALEVQSIDGVFATTPEGEEIEIDAFFSMKHAVDAQRHRRYWRLNRRATSLLERGTEVFLSLYDSDADPDMPADWVLSVDTSCSNRDLPNDLPFGGGHPHLKLANPVNEVAGIACMTAPTPTLRPPSGQRSHWRLVSHLSLNHLSLIDSDSGADALREILRLYNFRDSPETRTIIDSILSIKSSRVAARAPIGGRSVICRGLEIVVELDERGFSGNSLFVLTQVLDRFFGLYCSINSFTRLVAKVKGRQGNFKTWPPRAGAKPLL